MSVQTALYSLGVTMTFRKVNQTQASSVKLSNPIQRLKKPIEAYQLEENNRRRIVIAMNAAHARTAQTWKNLSKNSFGRP